MISYDETKVPMFLLHGLGGQRTPNEYAARSEWRARCKPPFRSMSRTSESGEVPAPTRNGQATGFPANCWSAESCVLVPSMNDSTSSYSATTRPQGSSRLSLGGIVAVRPPHSNGTSSPRGGGGHAHTHAPTPDACTPNTTSTQTHETHQTPPVSAKFWADVHRT